MATRRRRRRARVSFAVGLLLIAVVALGVRVTYVLVTNDMHLFGDARAYHALASHIADGDGFVRSKHLRATGEALPTAEKPPGFALWLAFLDVIGLSSYLAQRLVMACVGTGTVVLIGLLGRRVAGTVAGWVAAAIAAVYPPLFLADGALMPETLYGFLVVLVLLLAYRARDTARVGWWLLLGLVTGIAAQTRSEGFLLVLALGVPLALTRHGQPARRRVVLGAAALLAAVAAMTPWTVRNALTFHTFVPTSNQAGALIVGSNCPAAYYGDRAGLWLIECNRNRPELSDENQARAAQKRTRAGIRYFRNHLSRAPAVAAIRALRTWGLYHTGQQIRYEAKEGRSELGQTLGTLFMWCLVPFAVVGGLRRRHVGAAPVWMLVVPIGVVVVNSVLTYGNQRLRMGAEPSLVVLATLGLLVVSRALARAQAGPRALARAGTRPRALARAGTRRRPPSPTS
jgi:4-amino-4-deoxy-L-arabinose transferase-like glycosyltransferase